MNKKTKNKILIVFVLTLLVLSTTISAKNQIQNKIHKDLRKLIEQESKPKFGIFSITAKPEETVDVLVQLNDEEDLDNIGNKIELKQGNVKGKFKLGKVVTARVPVNKLKDISKDNKVKSIWPNQKYELLLHESVPQINAPSMWAEDYTGSGMKIAILDTGIDDAHPDFQGRIVMQNDFVPSSYIIDGFDYGDGDDDALAQDPHGHGTHCAGIAAGGGGYYTGVAPGASIIAINVFGADTSAFDSWIIEAINWVVDPDGNEATDDGTDIISLSLGSTGDSDGPLNQAIRDAISSGVVVVVASGNEGYNIPHTPANTEEAITVGAVTKQNDWASFSSGYDYGAYTKPDVAAPGVSIIAARAAGTSMGNIVDDYYTSASGTSMATPHVAGAAALLLQSNPGLTPEQVKYIMEQTAIDLGSPGKDIKYGSGLIDTSKFLPSYVNKLLKYKPDYSDFIYKGDPLHIQVQATMPSLVESITAIITRPDNAEYNFVLENSSNTWETYFYNTDILGVYSLRIIITEKQNNIVEFDESFDVIRYNLTQGMITELTIPLQVGFNETLPVTVKFNNTGDSVLNTLVEVQLIDSDNNLVYAEESDTIAVSAYQEYTFPFSLIADALPGNYKVKAIASFDGSYHSREKPLAIIDNTAPIIESIDFNSLIIKNSNLLAEVKVHDLSDLTGTMYVGKPSEETESIETITIAQTTDTKTVTGTFYNSTEQGIYTFYFHICDTNNLCIDSQTYQFEVQDCLEPGILVVEENSWENASGKYQNNLNNYCLSIWSKEKSGTPTLGYLDRFSGIIWTTGNYWGNNIDEESAALLQSYNGRLVLEGPDIAFTHGYDDFMKNVTHSIFKREIEAMNESLLSIIIDYPHMVFKNLPETFEFNSSLSPYPDSVEPYNNGVSLADWSINGSAVIGFNSNQSKVLFFPFMIDALTNDKNTLINNLGEWLTISNNAPDLEPINIVNNYLIEGTNQFDIEITNNGNEPANNFLITAYIDDVIEANEYMSLASGESNVLTMVIDNIPGNHMLKVVINNDFSVDETNYLNNVLTKELFVATTEADLTPANTFFEVNDATAIISADIENNGGSNTENVLIEFWVNGEIIETDNLNINYGETQTAFAEWEISAGIHTIEIKVNPYQDNTESDYSNNNKISQLYICGKTTPILIIEDSDTESYSTEQPSSIPTFRTVLENNGYCVDIWDESEKGTPSIDYVNQFDLVIWSAGDYWGNTINDSDKELISQYNGNIMFEGSDIAFDHYNDTFLQDYLYSDFDRDLILENDTEIIISNHEIFENISALFINNSLSPYPDSVLAYNGESIANWSIANTAIVAYNDSDKKMLYFTFSVDAVINDDIKERLIINAIEWLEKDGYITYYIKLLDDWNLVSVPLIQDNNSIESVFSSIEGKYDSLFTYNSTENKWKSYSTSKPSFLNTLKEIKPEKGYWIKLNENATLIINGTLPSSIIYNLKQGWNMISYPSLTEQPVQVVFADIDGTYTSVFAFINGSWSSYSPEKPPYLNTLQTMQPGYGYWINVNENITLLFNES